MKLLKNLNTVLLGSILSLTVLASVPIEAYAAERFDGVTIRVATWGGSWRDRIHKLIGEKFEERGGKVEYVIGNPLQNFNKLIAAKGSDVPFDIMEFQDDMLRPLKESGVLASLTGSGISDLSSNGFSVPTYILEEGIAYNADIFKEKGIPAPTKYSDLLDSRLEGHISWPDIGYGPYALMGLSTEFVGDELNVDPVFAKTKAADIPHFHTSSVELSTQFASGDVWASPWHAGWGVRVKRKGVPIAMAFPKVKGSKGISVGGNLGIAKGTEVQAAAEFWTRRYSEAEVQVALGKANGVAPTNAGALADLRADSSLAGMMLLTKEDMAGMYLVDWSKVDLSSSVNKWSRATGN